jgi:hypothetical protein
MIARCLLGIACCLLVVGCGTRGPTTYRVQGAITFDGRPVPGGRIDFVPDFNRGNSAMAGYASIEDAAYDTSSGGIGSAGGPMIVTVTGSLPLSANGEGQNGLTTIFEYTFTTDLPRAASALDVAVPASAGRTVQLTGPSP